MIPLLGVPAIGLTDEAIISRARALSPFFCRTVDANPALLPEFLFALHRPFTVTEMRAMLNGEQVDNEAQLKQILRRLRRLFMLRLIARDLGGLADLDEVTAACSDLAEVTIGFALERLDGWQRQVYGTPIGQHSGMPQKLIVVGMGKLGGRELNVSSDIDLIFAFEEDGETNGSRRLSNQEYFTLLGKKLIAAIGEVTGDGFVFRVDMRLRPYGESGPLVGSLAMLEQYYQQQGREWERYAWIKSRVITGPAEQLEALLRPFIYRKYLDYGALAAMRELKAQIMREVHRREQHDNIKLGPGGIREIEFIAQVFQLIRGGNDRALQIRPTRQVLALLAKEELLPAATVAALDAAYVFLRNLEHRLQYLNDTQTQLLPGDEANRQRVAQAMGYADWEAFMAQLKHHRETVERQFVEVFSFKEADQPPPHPLASVWQGMIDNAEAEALLVQHGYTDAGAVLHRLRALSNSGRYRHMPEASRSRFDALIPQILHLAAGFANADATLARLLELLESICRRASYLSLLNEYPQSLSMVARLVSASPWLAQHLTQHPILLDELLDTRTLYALPDFTALRQELGRQLADNAGDIERQMDIMRHFKHAQAFRFAAQDLAGTLALETLSDYLSALADLILEAVLDAVWPTIRERHRQQPRFAIIGYGKLGGKELGYASDLDLIFLYDDDAPQAGEVYARYAQRINAWLNSLTPAGQLYETDLRLRPDGASGLLVSPIAAFAEYQARKAWTWEHQALTRARFCAGDADIGAHFEVIREQTLRQPRDLAKLRDEVLAMRQKMREAHPNQSDSFDLKHDPGGIVDVEFIVQYLVLGHASRYPALTANIGNIALLRLVGELGLVPDELAACVAQAYRDYRREQHAQRLQGLTKTRVPPLSFAPQIAAVRQLWQQVFGAG